MYEPGTILALREPQSTDESTYPYDRVKVVGQSPVQHATASGSVWAGVDATGFIVQPLTEFAPTVDKPLGELTHDYEIEEYPTDPFTGEELRPENNPLYAPSPEQQLAAAAAKGLSSPAPPRERTPIVQDDRLTPEQALRTGTAARRKAAKS